MEDRAISADEAASLLGISQPRVVQLAGAGLIKKVGRGQYSMISAVQGYIGLLRKRAENRTEKAGNKRVSDARAREIEVRTAQRLGELVPLAIYDEMIEGFAGVVRSEFAGLPASCSRNLSERRIVERECNARLHRIAEFAMAQARLATVRGADDSFGADGAGHMGDGE